MNRDQFYAGEHRQLSTELDFGVWWRGKETWPVYRVSWVERTGDLYATNQSTDEIEILGESEPGNREMIEDILKGWADECGKIGSLNWVREQIHK